jgi:anti-sigma regulatory factor (Ser/Thr protein kinase)
VSGDEICLTLPADEAFHGVAHLVLGGLGVRLDLTYEDLQDLELALDALLERSNEDGDVTLLLRVGDGTIHTVVGPFTSLQGELETDGVGDSLNLKRILVAVCDRVDVEDRDGEQWVELTKAVQAKEQGGG